MTDASHQLHVQLQAWLVPEAGPCSRGYAFQDRRYWHKPARRGGCTASSVTHVTVVSECQHLHELQALVQALVQSKWLHQAFTLLTWHLAQVLGKDMQAHAHATLGNSIA